MEAHLAAQAAVRQLLAQRRDSKPSWSLQQQQEQQTEAEAEARDRTCWVRYWQGRRSLLHATQAHSVRPMIATEKQERARNIT